MWYTCPGKADERMSTPPDDPVQRLAEAIIEQMRPLSDLERERLVDLIDDAYCLYCGSEQSPQQRCQCTSDEF